MTELTVSEVTLLMKRQRELNAKFNMERWDEVIVSAAFMTEFAELLNEIPSDWKKWKITEDNEDNARVEFIDCVHFMLSLLIIRAENDPTGVNTYIPMYNETTPDHMTELMHTVKMFLISASSYPLSMLHFRRFVTIISRRLGIDNNLFYQLFEFKFRVNETRLANGYKTGDYTGKDDERFEVE